MVRSFSSDGVFTKPFLMGVVMSCVEKGAELWLVAEQRGELGLVLFCATGLLCGS